MCGRDLRSSLFRSRVDSGQCLLAGRDERAVVVVDAVHVAVAHGQRSAGLLDGADGLDVIATCGREQVELELDGEDLEVPVDRVDAA